jgi:protein SCO1/2
VDSLNLGTRILPRVLVAAMVAGGLFGAVACGGGETASSDAPLTGAEQVVADLDLAGSPFSVGLERPEFELTNAATGEPYDFGAETAGQVTLLYFGYTNCPDVCPVHMANIAAALDEAPFEVRDAVQVVFVGVDAPRDTPERVHEWLGHFDKSFIGLTGTAEELEAAQLAAHVPPAFVDEEFDGGYSVSHAGWVMVYTQDDLGHLRYPSGIRQSAWEHDLEVLVNEGWPT